MANKYRGEIDADFCGRPMRLCLTLGALAELEAAFGDRDLLALAERFGAGRLSATDAVTIIGAGLRGAGQDITDADVARLKIANGASGYIDVVARLLIATFGHATSARGGNGQPSKDGGAVRPEPLPFPGA
jgi:hypothetical protein